jgi:hypothetical protein
LAAARSAAGATRARGLAGDDADADAADWARMEGRVRSFADPPNAWVNQPDRRVGSSAIFAPEGGEPYSDSDGCARSARGTRARTAGSIAPGESKLSSSSCRRAASGIAIGAVGENRELEAEGVGDGSGGGAGEAVSERERSLVLCRSLESLDPPGVVGVDGGGGPRLLIVGGGDRVAAVACPAAITRSFAGACLIEHTRCSLLKRSTA